jgi:hypothetical protein
LAEKDVPKLELGNEVNTDVVAMNRFYIIPFIVMLLGCATFADIRQSEPVKSIFIADSATKEIAMCAAFKIKENCPSSTVIEKDGEFFISITSIGASGVWPIAEITFKPKDKGTLIELRRYAWMVSWQEFRLWDPIVKCTASQNNSGKLRNAQHNRQPI